MLHARILLRADEGPKGPGWIDEKICEALDVAVRTRMAFVEDGMKIALNGKPSKQRYHRRLDGEGEAKLVAMVCGPVPQGQRRWTLKTFERAIGGDGSH